MAKVLAVLYPDPASGYPPEYARDGIPAVDAVGDVLLTHADALDFAPGQLLGCVSGELGLRRFLEAAGHEYVVVSDVTGDRSDFLRELPTADVVVSQPSWPIHLSAARIAAAPRLQLAVVAGAGTDGIDLEAAARRGITVAETSATATVSIAEHAVMLMLTMAHDFLAAHACVTDGGWDIAGSVERSYDLQGMRVGVVGAGAVGLAVLHRLAGFGVGLHYSDPVRLRPQLETELALTYVPDVAALVRSVDILSIHAPLTPETYHLVDEAMIESMPRGSYVVNLARAELVERDAIVRALSSGRLAGYGGDAWYPEPPPITHPWRSMRHAAMTPHVAGATLPAQARSAAAVREILESWFAGAPIRSDFLVVSGR
ncbi:NAD-dependent formate dehydrogenase [Lacisediminihabitans changchengi]|uniref:NAD-dependent formate dehydrogenase n=1 Tax=Lacisediminihabitans changchengi TaxID=2787634 RepID=A0A934SJE9_9MICO|nr:NAD-dependent formate dehydrogenase [Lacisediminihabitans changchengi]MBK4346390.1 NAD-dependent formate dehydrogenase [Lacisediminihabitans changchengi]